MVQELQQVVKLGRASEAALESVGGAATDALVADYALAPAPATALRTPAAHDRVLAEAQNVMALTHVDTPLKGGLNTPLAAPAFAGGAAQTPHTPHTPNTVLATPFRSARGDPSTPAGFGTPANGPAAGRTALTVSPAYFLHPLRFSLFS